jgi:tetrapyrrole methylase family protein/MazG family protein
MADDLNLDRIDLNEICAQLHIAPLAAGLQVADARRVAEDHFPRLDTDVPALIANMDTVELARAVSRTLRVNYPADHPVTLLSGGKVRERTLKTIGRGKPARGTVLYIPAQREPGSPQTLACLVARLRAPGGCPWDRKQTHKSLRRALLEETYEVIEALDEEDSIKLREELGDLLLHVLFQTGIARDNDEFSLSEVGQELAAKLIRRHPHVFGETEVANAEEVVANWERIKQDEKRRAGKEQSTALPRAQKVYERARRRGAGPSKRLPSDGLARLQKGKHPERELGELLFSLAAWAEENELDASTALNAATARFVKRADAGG